jgi:ATP-binding cassette, subfamily B, bacterial MsbA
MIGFLQNIWGFVRPYRVRFFLGLLCGVLYGLTNGLLLGVSNVVMHLTFEKDNTNLIKTLESAPPFLHPAAHWVTQHLPDLHAPDSQVAQLVLISLIPAVMLLRVTLGYSSVYLTNWSAMHAIADVRIKLFAHLQNLSLGFFTRNSTGDLIARITNDTTVLYGIIGGAFASMARDPVMIVVTLATLLTLQPKLTIISFVVFPACVVPIMIFGRKVRKSARAVQEYNAMVTNLMHESFTGNRVIKAYNLESTVIEQFNSIAAKFVNQLMRVIRANEIPSQLMELFAATGIALVFFYVLRLPESQRPDMVGFGVFIFAIVTIYGPIKNLTKLHNQLQQARAASERVFQLLATKNSIPEPAAPKMLHADKADIVFENVDFSFGDKKVLSQINLTVKAGQMVALVGASGSGKTTLANLLLRFYDPDHGSIKIGGTDIRDVRTRDLRDQMAVVAQENILFNESIRRNIELGRLGAKEEEIVAAAKHAHCLEFIAQKEAGFDTVIGEKGVTLSGGQRQRLAIARAVLRNAPILVLDEATSALDTESERAVQSALDELMQGRTTICIAHRLSTILHADMIVVLSDGRIAETGKHDELVKRGGVYQKLYELQFAA